jgi:parallel beta-helix repeat protein
MRKIVLPVAALMLFAVMISPVLAIDLTDCATLDVENGYYNLLNDASAAGCFPFEADNVTLDCNGHTVSAGSGHAFTFGGYNSPHLLNCKIADTSIGIYCDNNDGLVVRNVNMSDASEQMVSLSNCINIELTDIRCTGVSSECGQPLGVYYSSNVVINNFVADGDVGDGSSLNGAENLTINGMVMPNMNGIGLTVHGGTNHCYFNYLDFGQTTEDYNILVEEGSTFNVFNHVKVKNENYNAIYVIESDDNIFNDVECTDTASACMYIDDSLNTTLNDIRSYGAGDYGVALSRADYTVLDGCQVVGEAGSDIGVYIYESDETVVTNCNIEAGDWGVGVESGSYNVQIFNNTFTGALNEGIYFWDSSGNYVYNNLFNNTVNAKDYTAGTNSWNTDLQTGQRIYGYGQLIGGNFWASPSGDGFSETCMDADVDGICDSVYEIDDNNHDSYPLSNKASLHVGDHVVDLQALMSDAGSGLGNFLDTVTDPTVNIVLGLGLVGGILAVLMGLVGAITGAVRGATRLLSK